MSYIHNCKCSCKKRFKIEDDKTFDCECGKKYKYENDFLREICGDTCKISFEKEKE